MEKGKKILLAGLLSLFFSVFFLFLFYGSPRNAGAWLHLMERKILDAEFRNIPRSVKADPSIVIVTINDTALRAMEPKYGRWPWPRRVMGEMVEYLRAIGVRAIGIDILYPERNAKDPQGDRFFVDQVHKAGKVVLAADFPENRKPLFPFASLFKASAGIGGVHLSADPDGPTRRYQHLYHSEGKTYPSLALGVAQQLSLQIQPEKIPLLKNGTFNLHWYGPKGAFPYIEADKILEAREEWKSGGPEAGLHEQASEFFKDKVVFIGVTATGLFDLRANPYSPVYPGVEIHATALSNLWHGDFIRRAPPPAVILFVLLIPLLAGLGIVMAQSPLKELLVTALASILATTCGILAFQKSGLWVPIALTQTVLLVNAATLISWNYFTTGREKRFLRNAFARYLTEDVLKELLNHPEGLKLGGENATLTVLFSDIRDFTTLSEKLKPDEVVALLNEYLTAMVDIVFQHQGTLDKFIGDAVMAFWGAPVKTEDHAAKAVRAGLAMLEKVGEIRARWQSQGKPLLKIGIGINTAPITVGNIGSEKCQSYTVIGDGVNLASRLESLNKTYHTELIVSEFTYERIREKAIARTLDEVKVKGKEQSVKIYEVTGWKG
ncbi:MAG: adenylate/guanylate cyclase domain-containing protein [Deltaproteobacteria bacterium]|nr:adenylate/guanylate cyclase domain-containing protein [Deltaproteobacteria bacterium]